MPRLARDFILAILLLGAAQILTTPKPVVRDTVPCSTDQDCADKNPGVTGLYALPGKGTR